METEFMSITERVKLNMQLELGDKEAVRTVMDELIRLESVIKDYEIGINQINKRFNSKTFKRPAIHPTNTNNR